MTHIQFIAARFPDPQQTQQELEKRLRRFLLDRRRQKIELQLGHALDPSEIADAGYEEGHRWPRPRDAVSDDWDAQGFLVFLSLKDGSRIRSRAKRLLDRREAASGLKQLRRDDRERLEGLRGGVQLVNVPSEQRADELAAELHAQFPWLGPATEAVWRGMRRSAREGLGGLRLPPLLLDGPPGIGKSAWGRHLARLLDTPLLNYEASTENASFGLVGSQRGWSNGAPGRLLQTILTSRVGNPVAVVDEVEKAGTTESVKGQTFALTAALLPLLEPATSGNWSCPYFEVRFDMSWVIWVLTSNDWRGLPEPLLSRCPPIRLPEITRANLVAFARRVGAQRGLSEASIEAIVEALEHPANRTRRLSLRSVIRMLDRAKDMEGDPPPS